MVFKQFLQVRTQLAIAYARRMCNEMRAWRPCIERRTPVVFYIFHPIDRVAARRFNRLLFVRYDSELHDPPDVERIEGTGNAFLALANRMQV